MNNLYILFKYLIFRLKKFITSTEPEFEINKITPFKDDCYYIHYTYIKHKYICKIYYDKQQKNIDQIKSDFTAYFNLYDQLFKQKMIMENKMLYSSNEKIIDTNIFNMFLGPFCDFHMCFSEIPNIPFNICRPSLEEIITFTTSSFKVSIDFLKKKETYVYDSIGNKIILNNNMLQNWKKDILMNN